MTSAYADTFDDRSSDEDDITLVSTGPKGSIFRITLPGGG